MTALTAQAFMAALRAASGDHQDFEDGAAAPVAVAVSGGADSLALTLLAAQALGASRVVGLTVDHGLRENSAREAGQVSTLLARFRIAHHILHWRGEKPRSNIQATARRARYQLLEDECVARGIDWLLLAHHQSDQAETVMLRLARGSGVDGLAAMAASQPALTRRDGPCLLRPLLDVDALSLRTYLREKGVEWVEDPSNENLEFDRIKIRQLLANPPLAGFTAPRLANVARNMRRARVALESYTDELSQACVNWFATGHAELSLTPLCAAPEEIALRCLARVLRRAAGREYAPRLEQLERLLEAIKDRKAMECCLGGAQILASKQGYLLVTREPAAITQEVDLSPGQTVTWDRRFNVHLAPTATSCRLRALGDEGWLALKKAAFQPRAPLRHVIGLSQPSLWNKNNLLAVPTLDYAVPGWQAGDQAVTISLSYALQ